MSEHREELIQAARTACAEAYIFQIDQAAHVLSAILPLLTAADVPHLAARRVADGTGAAE